LAGTAPEANLDVGAELPLPGEHLDAARLVDVVQLLPVEVLEQRVAYRFRVGAFVDHPGDGLDLGLPGRPQATLTGDEPKAALLLRSDADRLDDARLLDGPGQPLEGVRVDVGPRVEALLDVDLVDVEQGG